MSDATRLDVLTPLHARVGYGTLGVRGDLGYEGKRVRVGQRDYQSAISSHPPARALYRLDGAYQRFQCSVALNDDVPAGQSHADFQVIADGLEVARASFLKAGEPPRPLVADVSGAQQLELVVTTGRWEWCHAVWLDPVLDAGAVPPRDRQTLTDCLGRAEITLPAIPPRVRHCIATVASAGFAGMLDDLLGSLAANGRCHDARRVVFSLGDDAACAQVAAKHRALLIPCRPRAGVNPMSKGLLYSAARVIDADAFLCLDADMLVLDDLRPLFGALAASPEGTIYACREGNGHGLVNLGHALEAVYGGSGADFQRLLGHVDAEWQYPLVVNDGIFAGGRCAMLALDGAIRAMPQASSWVDERRDIWWRNQFVFNLALACLRCGAELDSAYNVQLHVQDVQLRSEGARVRAGWRGRDARILHFSGVGRRKYPEWKGLFAKVADPLPGGETGDNYAEFLAALRAWLGRRGLKALAASCYGTSDGRDGRVRDTAALPLLALLHYLLRANGCVRVIETATGPGVATACIASAIAHREGAAVVSYDPRILAERAELWDALPAELRTIIDARHSGALEGLTADLAGGQRYDAALLDCSGSGDQVWGQFQLAAKLVCPGGLILVHGVRRPGATAEQTVRQIEAAGYGVTRLWSADGGVQEDDGLGLAVVENRRRARARRE